MSTTTRTWFITGSSRGFGRVWAEAALNRGDNVVLTARATDSVARLVEQFPKQTHAIQLDVTDRDAVFAAVQEGLNRFGQLDIIVANAGYGLFGAVEETTESQARRQLEVNVFGALWLFQAIAPVLRAQQHGRVLITSSFGGLISFPTAALYGASKYALEGLGEAFAQETQDFGTKVTLIEPGAYATDFSGDSGDQTEANPAYDGARGRTGEVFRKMPVADPIHTGDAILALTDMDEPPLRLILGEHVLPLVLDSYDERIASWQKHQPLAASAQ